LIKLRSEWSLIVARPESLGFHSRTWQDDTQSQDPYEDPTE
jgi:hypothetical protein